MTTRLLAAALAAAALGTPAMAATTILADLTATGTKTFTFKTTGGIGSIAVNSIAVAAGEISDPSIYVFQDDLNGTEIAYNDDSASLNSFVEVNFAPGTYVATVGRYYFSPSEARSGAANFEVGETGFQIVFSDGLNVQTAVPEPATWGMMLLGFGLVGAVARRRRATLAAA